MEEKSTRYKGIGPLNLFTATINESDDPPTAFITIQKKGNKGEARFPTSFDDLTQMAKVANQAKAKFKALSKKLQAQKTAAAQARLEIMIYPEMDMPPIAENDLNAMITDYFKGVTTTALAEQYPFYTEAQIRFHLEKKGIVLLE